MHRSGLVSYILILASFLFPAHAEATSVPSKVGKFENRSDIASESLRVRVTWYCRKRVDGATSPVCRARHIESDIVNGRWQTPAFDVPETPALHRTHLEVAIVVPGQEPLIAVDQSMDEIDRSSVDIGLFQIDAATIQFQLSDGRNFWDWLNNEAPGRELRVTVGANAANAHHSYDQSHLPKYIRSKSIELERQYFALPTEGGVEMRAQLRLEQSGVGAGGAPLVTFSDIRYSGPWDSDFFSSNRILVLDVSNLNTDISGVWDSGVLLVDDLGRLNRRALANPTVQLDARCRQGRLEGVLTTSYNEPPRPGHRHPVLGTCRNGYARFRGDIILREYSGPNMKTFPLEFEFESISNHFAYGKVESLLHRAKAGAIRLQQ